METGASLEDALWRYYLSWRFLYNLELSPWWYFAQLFCACSNIGIKHGFSCINTRQVPREVLKTKAWSLFLHKNWKYLLHFALFLALFCFAFFTNVSQMQFPRTILVPGPGSTHLVAAANQWPRYHHIESFQLWNEPCHFSLGWVQFGELYINVRWSVQEDEKKDVVAD